MPIAPSFSDWLDVHAIALGLEFDLPDVGHYNRKLCARPTMRLSERLGDVRHPSTKCLVSRGLVSRATVVDTRGGTAKR